MKKKIKEHYSLYKINQKFPTNSIFYIFDDNLKLEILYKILLSKNKKDDFKFINFNSLLKLIYNEKKNIEYVYNFVGKVLFYNKKNKNLSKFFLFLTKFNIEDKEINSKLFCNFSDGQKIIIIILILSFFKDRNIFIEKFILDKIDFKSKKYVLEILLKNNNVFTYYSFSNQLKLSNIYFILRDNFDLNLIETSQNLKFNFKEIQYKNVLSTALKNIKLSYTKKNINLNFFFSELKKIKFVLTISLIDNMRTYSSLTLTEKNLNQNIIKTKINIKNFKYFCGMLYFKFKEMNYKSKKSIKIVRHSPLFIYINRQKNNTQFTICDNLVKKND